jgi:energy-coupling factor transporter ATP-binding protein EcfA2
MERQTTSTQTTTKTIQSPYDYYEILQTVISKGKEMFGPGFYIDDTDRPVIMNLITYFMRDENVAAAKNIDLYKGLIITGPVGCGKTAIMKILRALLPRDGQFVIRSCCRTSLDFLQDGYQTIERYTFGSFEPYSTRPRTCCFDDLGIEKDANHWGNTCNVMAEILFHRYDLFMEHHMLTHLTTNMSSSELEERYGNRLRSRIRQMCQLVGFPTDSKDKRQ